MDNPAAISSYTSDTSHTTEWTAKQTAFVLLLAVICSVLVWNVCYPEDVYLSDLKYEVLQGDVFDPRDDQSVNGNTLQVHKTFYPKGVGVHANSEIFLRFIPEGYTHFEAEIGVDAEVGDSAESSVVFQVFASVSDGKTGTESTLLYESPVLRPGMNPRFIQIPVEGRRSLTLRVLDAGDGSQDDHANWALARFSMK